MSLTFASTYVNMLKKFLIQTRFHRFLPSDTNLMKSLPCAECSAKMDETVQAYEEHVQTGPHLYADGEASLTVGG